MCGLSAGKFKYLFAVVSVIFLFFTVSCSEKSSTSNVNEADRNMVVIKAAEPEVESEDERSHPEKSAHRQLGEHVHGAASMNLVLERNQLDVAISIPGMDAVGFEHAAITKENRESLKETLGYLQKANAILVMPENAGCSLIKGEVATALLNKTAKENSHADVDIGYQWQCKHPENLKTITVELFAHFSHLQKIQTNWILNERQGANELTPLDNVLKLE